MVMTRAEISARYRNKDVEVYRKRKREWAKTPEQKEKRRVYMRKWVAKNREKFNKMSRESHKRSRTPRKVRAWMLKQKYGLTLEQFQQKLDSQGGKCLICETDAHGGRNWHVDHCHDTGKIRGILCNKCNPALGWFEKYKTAAEAYLNRKE